MCSSLTKDHKSTLYLQIFTINCLFAQYVNEWAIPRFVFKEYSTLRNALSMDNLHNRLKVELGWKNEIFYHS